MRAVSLPVECNSVVLDVSERMEGKSAFGESVRLSMGFFTTGYNFCCFRICYIYNGTDMVA